MVQAVQDAGPWSPTSEPTCQSIVWRSYREGGQLLFALESAEDGPMPWRVARRRDDSTDWQVLNLSQGRTGVEDGELWPHALAFPLGEVVVLDALVRRRGFLCHSCGVIDPGVGGMMFCGRSGRGKSTIGGLWLQQGATIVSDDRVAIRSTDTGHALHGTPWHGDLAEVAPKQAPLRGVFFLEHAPETVIQRLEPGESARRFLDVAWQPTWAGAETLQGMWSHIAQVAREVPIYSLRFRPEPAALEEVRRVVASHSP